MKKFVISIISGFALAALFLASCSQASTSSQGSLNILASTTFLADIAQNVAGHRAQVTSLVPVGADPHEYQTAPSDVTKITASNVLILNGVEYEHFIKPLLDNAGGQRLVITASDGLEARMMPDETNTGQLAGDPHMWLDPNRVVRYVENIRDGLIKSDPHGADVYKTNAEAYIAQLKVLDAWIMAQVKIIPVEHRLLVTNHDAMGYFADRYGFTIIATVIPSVSTDASTSAKQLAEVIDQIKSSGAPAIFLGEVENPNLANQIAAETGAKVINDLHLESLTDGPPAGTYLDMMKYNVTQIVDALK